MELRGASAIVTGGASGLGEATVRRLHNAGVAVTILDRNAEAGDALARELGGGANFAQADVTNYDECAAGVEQAASSGALRICVNCAGLGIAMRTINRDNSPHDPGAFNFLVGINLVGTFNVMTLAASKIAQTDPTPGGDRGVIVNTASVAAFDGQIGQLAYSATKGAVVGMTLPAARDLAAVGIRVNSIAPGLMDTPLLATLADPARQALSESVLYPKRLGVPDEYASLVMAIVDNGYLNGETIRLDGGIRMPPK
ncbi:MAG TPA: SDR family NAD(P)-dependent oxidoreductase [Acidimicrobiales bacterium]|nr:SDR family NAD(P)-dependent oxidoreductase [Acidimicrobiales bacterium]